jgi:2-polyprenyl-6-methoxyphenol hydroxylase-like FAD-dependent oxidoreductase
VVLMSVSFSNPDSAVAIAGGGPTGLMLAAELALAGVEVAVLERRSGQELDGSRAGGLHARTIEIFDQRGVAERFVGEGQKHEVVLFAEAALDIRDLPTRHPYTLGLWQKHIERIMAEWVGELGVAIHHGHEVSASPRMRPASTSGWPTAGRCGPPTSSAATAAAASSAGRPASTSPVGTRRGAR